MNICASPKRIDFDRRTRLKSFQYIISVSKQVHQSLDMKQKTNDKRNDYNQHENERRKLAFLSDRENTSVKTFLLHLIIIRNNSTEKKSESQGHFPSSINEIKLYGHKTVFMNHRNKHSVFFVKFLLFILTI